LSFQEKVPRDNLLNRSSISIGLSAHNRQPAYVLREREANPKQDTDDWAQEHADRLDPMTNGFLEKERQRLASPDDEENEKEEETEQSEPSPFGG